MLEREERWLLPLLLVSESAAGPDEPFPIDRVRLQKAVFLLTHGSTNWANLYNFKPYNWGPYSSDLTHDAESLAEQGYVRLSTLKTNRYGNYLATPIGNAYAHGPWISLENAERVFIRAVRSFVTGRSFNQLLRDVYAAFPDFATESLFRR